MSQQEEKNVSALNAQLKELTEENEALFEQLHVVQEELERYYHKLKEAEQNTSSAGSATYMDDELPKALAENHRLQSLVETQKNVLVAQRDNSLATRLGNILIEGTGSTGTLLALPCKLRRIWRAEEQKVPPSELGGKDFSTLIAAYDKGGMEAVETLLNSVFISASLRASAYTALARYVMPQNVGKAAELARKAYEVDPRPFRLKWLAFRMHDAGDALHAQAMLDLLPTDINMSESEVRQVTQIRRDVQSLYQRKAQGTADTEKKRAEAENKLRELVKAKEAQEKLAAERAKDIERLQSAMKDLEREKSALAERCERADVEAREYEDKQSLLTDQYQSLEQQVLQQQQEAKERATQIEALKSREFALQQSADQYKIEAHTLRAEAALLQNLGDERKLEVDRLIVRYDELHKLYQEEVRLVTAQQKDILSAIASQDSVLGLQFEKQGSELERARKAIQHSCKYEIENALQQTVAFGGLKEYFATGELPQVTPWKRGWPASPDFILWLVELIENNDYDLILEFGSGITTLYTAKAIAAREIKGVSAKSTAIVSFDHLEQFFQQTKDMLTQVGLGGRASVIHAPLQEYTAPDGVSYQYYACQDVLKELAQQYKSVTSRILVIVDGPPGATNKNARYPAFPLVMKYFASARIDFLLDDYIRGDEKELAGLWQATCATAGIEHEVIVKSLEKEALLLSLASAVSV